MQRTIKARVPRQVYFDRLVTFWQLDIQAAVGKNVAQQRLVGYTYLREAHGQTIGVKILACEPGAYLAYELTRHGITRQCAYRLRSIAGDCTAVTYSERTVDTQRGRLLVWGQALCHCLAISIAASRLARCYDADLQAPKKQTPLPILQGLEEDVS